MCISRLFGQGKCALNSTFHDVFDAVLYDTEAGGCLLKCSVDRVVREELSAKWSLGRDLAVRVSTMRL